MKKNAVKAWTERWTVRGFARSLSVAHWVEGKVPSHGDAEEGSTTVEYSIGAIAAAGFAGLLVAVLKSGGVKNLITNIIQSALSI